MTNSSNYPQDNLYPKQTSSSQDQEVRLILFLNIQKHIIYSGVVRDILVIYIQPKYFLAQFIIVKHSL